MKKNNKLNVLFVSPSGTIESGGIAKWTSNILNFYTTTNDDLINIIHCVNPLACNAYGSDSIYVRFKKGVRNYYPLYKSVKSYIQNSNIEVLHLCTSASISLIKDIAILSAARRKKVKTVTHFHFGRIPAVIESKNWEYYLLHQVFKLSDKVVVMDMKSYKVLQKLNYTNIVYLPNPLSLDTQNLIEKNIDSQRISNKIVFVGHVLETKGVKELVLATKSIPNVQVHIIGYIPNQQLVNELNEIAGENSQHWLHVEGVMTFDKVIHEMSSAGIFVLPTYSEGFPNVIIESMACSCPIITTPVGAIPEMLNIESSSPCGVCVDVKNVEKLKEAILKMLSDANLANEYGKRARARVYQLYSVDKIWTQLKTVWLSV